MITENCKISIIVPVYNAEEYLHICVDSILSQTYCNFELILVNDGSTDSSSSICEKYAAVDTRVKVIHQKNCGRSSARNTGIKHAIGEYIFFSDNDDFVPPNSLEKLVECVKESNADIIQGYYEFFSYELLEKYVPRHNWQNTPHNSISLIDFCSNTGWRNYIWGKLYKRTIIKNCEFPVGHNGEDSFFNAMVLTSNDSLFISTVNVTSYCHLDNKMSVSHNYSAIDYIDMLKTYEHIYKYVCDNSHNESLHSVYFKFLLNNIALTRYYLKVYREYNKTYKSIISCFVKKYLKIIIYNNKMPIKYKIFFYLSLNSSSFYRLFLIINDPSMLIFEKNIKKHK